MDDVARRKRIFVSTGCSSSDVLLAPVLAELRERRTPIDVAGFGGEPLREEGVELLFDSTPLSTIGTASGIAMAARSGWGMIQALRRLKRQFENNRPDLVVLVDNAGINFRVMSIAHRMNIPILYYVPPELWSVWWFELGALKRANPKVATIFPAQKDEYDRLGLDADWLGHPMVDLVRSVPTAPATVGSAPVIGLFPGSRRQEVTTLIEPMRQAAEAIRLREPNARFILCAANPLADRIIREDLPRWKVPAEIRYRQAHATLSESHLVLACSGTVTLEATLIGVPLIAMYKLRGLLDNVAQKLILPKDKYHFFSLPNLLLERRVITELSNRDVNAERISAEALKILRDPQRRQQTIDDLHSVRPLLGDPGAVARAADLVAHMLAPQATTTSKAA